MKKIIITLTFMILLLGSVSALTWDNTKSYDELEKEVIVKNSLSLGDEVARLKLITPLNNVVPIGYNKVAEFEMTYYKDSNGGLDELKLYDTTNDMKEIERQVDYKVKVQEDYEVNDYKEVCEYDLKSINQSCEKVLVGTHTEQRDVWKNANEIEFELGKKYNIGLFTDVKKDDKVEWIPKYFGVTIEEWALWTGTDAPVAYYKLDETTGDVVDATGNGNDGTNYGATRGVNGKINNAFDFERDDGDLLNVSGLNSTALNRTFSFWLKPESIGDGSYYVFDGRDGDGNLLIGRLETHGIDFGIYEGSGDNAMNLSSYKINEWQHYVLLMDGSNGKVTCYRNGVETGSSLFYDHSNLDGSSQIGIGNIYGGDAGGEPGYDGLIDEFGIWERLLTTDEVSDLYNSGEGLSYGNEFVIELLSPEDEYQTNSNVINFSANVTLVLEGISIENVSLLINGNINETNTSGVNGIYNWSKTLENGAYNWRVQSYDNESNFYESEIRTFEIGINPPTIDVQSPTGTSDYATTGQDETLNVTFTDAGLDTCWYNYNGTNITLSCSSGVKVTETFNLLDYGAEQNLTIWANDSNGNLASELVEWDYKIFQKGLTYESSVVEGDTAEHSINISYDSDNYIASGNIFYNGTEYSGTKTGTGDDIVISREITAPSVDAITNVSFYWEIGITNSTGTYYINTSNYNQTINILNMSETGSPHTPAFINFTAYDEQTLEEINATLDLTLNYKTKTGTVDNDFSFSDQTENNSRWSFALDPSDKTYLLDAVLQIDATDYTQKFYNFKGLEVTNTTTEFDLFLLNTSASTTFIIKVKDEDYLPISDVEVWTQRYYPSTNEWETIEIDVTNSEGETTQHFFTEDAKYRFKIYEDGTLIHTTEETLIYCEQTPCTVEITLPSDYYKLIDEYGKYGDLDSSITYDETSKDVEFSYSDTSGNFTSSRLHVIRSNYGNSSINAICNITGSSSTAILTCDLTGELNGTYIASGYITRNGVEKLTNRIILKKDISIVEEVGLDGVLWSVFILIGIMMLGVYRPSLGIIFGSMGVVMLSLLNLISIPMMAIIAIVGIAIILLIGVKRQ